VAAAAVVTAVPVVADPSPAARALRRWSLASMSARLRVMSYNVRYFGHALRGLASTRRSKLGIARGISALDPAPDVICLQEVETSSVRANIAAGKRRGETQLEAFTDAPSQAWGSAACPYGALYFRAHTDGLARWPVYTTGLAVRRLMESPTRSSATP